jgi:hypothetical protein
MVVYLSSKILRTGGSNIIKFEIENIYRSRYVFGFFQGPQRCKMPDVFMAKFVVDDKGDEFEIHREDLRWFHYEDSSKMLIFDHFLLPHYVQPGDKLLYLE